MKKLHLLLLFLLFVFLLTSCSPPSYEGNFHEVIQRYTKEGHLYENRLDSSGYLTQAIYIGEDFSVPIEELSLMDKKTFYASTSAFIKLDKLFKQHFSSIPQDMDLPVEDGEVQGLATLVGDQEEKREGIKASLHGPKEFKDLYVAFNKVIRDATQPRG